jgi:hypothetical protein
MPWVRILAKDKLSFSQDLQSDPTLTDLQKRMISVVATHWDNDRMAAECSLSFIAAGAGTTKKMVNKYALTLAESGRVSIKRAATYTASALWDVNWWFRGSAWVRHTNGGKPTVDCRKESPNAAAVCSDEESPNVAIGGPPVLRGGVPQAGDQFPSQDGDRRPSGARPFEGAQVAPKKERKEKPHATQPGFAKWRIVHAEFTGSEQETFVAHLRSGKSRKFVFRCHVNSDDYGSIYEALDIDSGADPLIGQMVQMSTNATGAKAFLRAAPFPWTQATIVSAEANDDGSVRCQTVFHDDGRESVWHIGAEDADALAAACGGQSQTIGARVRYRLLVDDTIEFQRVRGLSHL